MKKPSGKPALKPLPRTFYERPATSVGLDLLGCLLCHQTVEGLLAGRITELEVYLGRNDPASHAFKGNKGRARIFWQGAGIAYIYFIYGAHLCFNVITHHGQDVAGILIRALEPVQGIGIMRENRHVEDFYNLTTGPGKITRALNITLADNGRDLTRGTLFISKSRSPASITITPRIGITKATEVPLRFYASNNAFISRVKEPVIFSGSKPEVLSFLCKFSSPVNLCLKNAEKAR